MSAEIASEALRIITEGLNREVIGTRLDIANDVMGIANSVLGIRLNLQSAQTNYMANRLESALTDKPDEAAELERLIERYNLLSRSQSKNIRIDTSGNRNTIAADGGVINNVVKRHPFLSVVALVAVGLLAWFLITILPTLRDKGSDLIAPLTRPTITANTLCADYLSYDTETRYEAVRRVGLEVKNPDPANPLTAANTDYRCGLYPKSTLGEVLAP